MTDSRTIPSARRIAHTGITVSNLRYSIGLWQDVLGFALLGSADLDGVFLGDLIGVPGARVSAAVLTKGEQSIELLQYHAPGGRQDLRPRPVDVGSVHVALEVDDVAYTVAACQAYGLVLTGSVVTGEGVMEGTRMAYLHTPDGVTLELLQPLLPPPPLPPESALRGTQAAGQRLREEEDEYASIHETRDEQPDLGRSSSRSANRLYTGRYRNGTVSLAAWMKRRLRVRPAGRVTLLARKELP